MWAGLKNRSLSHTVIIAMTKANNENKQIKWYNLLKVIEINDCQY